MSIRWWWAGAGTLGGEYIGPDTDVRTHEHANEWNEDDVTDVGALVLGDGNDALVIEGSPEALHAFLRRLGATLPADPVADVRDLRQRIAELGKDAGRLALEIHREHGGASRIYGDMHTTLGRLGGAVNRLNSVIRTLEENKENPA